MPAARTSPRDPFWYALGGIGVVALAIRVAFVAIKQSSVKLAGDAAYYFIQAQAVADGHGFVAPFVFRTSRQIQPGADHPPGFVIFLAVLNKLGIRSDDGQRYVMCVLGTATVIVIGLLGRKLFGNRFGLIAATLAAIYPQVWINDGMLMSETLFVFSLVFALYFIYDMWQAPSWRALVLATFGLIGTSSTRPESVLLFVLLLVPVVLGRRELLLKKRVLMVAASAVITVVVFSPWVIYNINRFEKPVYLSTGFGQTLLVANCPSTYSGPFLGWYNSQCLFSEAAMRNATGDASVNDGKYRDKAIAFMRENKGQLPKVILAREGRMWTVWRVDQMAKLDGWIEGRGSVALSRWAQRSYWLMALLAIPGMVLWRRRKVPMYPLVIQFAVTAFVAAITFGVTRYRAGAEISLVFFAAMTLDWGMKRITNAT